MELIYYEYGSLVIVYNNAEEGTRAYYALCNIVRLYGDYFGTSLVGRRRRRLRCTQLASVSGPLFFDWLPSPGACPFRACALARGLEACGTL